MLYQVITLLHRDRRKNYQILNHELEKSPDYQTLFQKLKLMR